MYSTGSLFKIIFTFEADNSTRTIEYYLPVDPSTREAHLNPALQDATQRGLPLDKTQLFHLDYSKRLNIFLGVYPFSQEIKIPFESVINNSIQINSKPTIMPSGEMIQQLEEQVVFEKNATKNKKVKERTIQQAIAAVRQWRYYYDTPDNQTGRRLYTLDQAARKVGIAKKTLDDYYNHLRIAQEFDFNLQRFSQSKIGILRKFVKIAKEQGREGLQREMSMCLIETNIEKYWTDFNQM